MDWQKLYKAQQSIKQSTFKGRKTACTERKKEKKILCSSQYEYSSVYSRSCGKEKWKSLMPKEVWNNWDIFLSDLSKLKVIQNSCLACSVSFNNFTVTLNGLDKMHILNWLSSTHYELHFIQHQTTSVTSLMVLYAVWTGRITFFEISWELMLYASSR